MTPTLFDVAPLPRSRFLTGIYKLLEALQQSPTLDGLVRDAAAAAPVDGTQNRGSGEQLEHEINMRLTEEAQQAIGGEVAEVVGDTLGEPVSEVRWFHRSPRSGRDFDIEVWIGARRLLLPVNVKRLAEGTPDRMSAEVAAVSNILRAARGGDLDEPLDVSVSRTAVRWMAGREKIRQADYVLWTVEAHDDGTVERWHMFGVLSSVRNGRLTISRHPSREVMMGVRPDGALPEGFDVNRALAEAVMPTATADALRLTLTALAARLRPDDAEGVAAMLDDADDEELDALAEGMLSLLVERRAGAPGRDADAGREG